MGQGDLLETKQYQVALDFLNFFRSFGAYRFLVILGSFEGNCDLNLKPDGIFLGMAAWVVGTLPTLLCPIAFLYDMLTLTYVHDELERVLEIVVPLPENEDNQSPRREVSSLEKHDKNLEADGEGWFKFLGSWQI